MISTMVDLRHILATLAYRAGKAMRGAPPSFADFRVSDSARTPLQIVAHIGDLVEWACVLARGERTCNYATPQAWDREVQRFFDALQRVDYQRARRSQQC